MRSLTDVDPVSRTEERQLVVEYQNGDLQARDQLILANMRFIVALAKKLRRPDVDMNDMIQGGVIGLVRAIDKFDPTLPTRLLTMAYWWIRRGMIDAAEGQQLPRLKPAPSAVDTDESWYYEDLSAAADVEDPSPSVEEVVDIRLQVQEIRAHMRELPLRQRTIVEMKCGLWGGRALNNPEIGKKLGLSGERVRQLYNDAIEKIQRRVGLQGE